MHIHIMHIYIYIYIYTPISIYHAHTHTHAHTYTQEKGRKAKSSNNDASFLKRVLTSGTLSDKMASMMLMLQLCCAFVSTCHMHVCACVCRYVFMYLDTHIYVHAQCDMHNIQTMFYIYTYKRIWAQTSMLTARSSVHERHTKTYSNVWPPFTNVYLNVPILFLCKHVPTCAQMCINCNSKCMLTLRLSAWQETCSCVHASDLDLLMCTCIRLRPSHVYMHQT